MSHTHPSKEDRIEDDSLFKGVVVEDLSFNELFAKASYPVSIDTYQRGFVWNDEKIVQLVSDLEEHFLSKEVVTSYYMGTVLLHRHDGKEKLYIIDGQQRITALSLLFNFLSGELPLKCEMQYSPSSARNIVKAHEVFKRRVDGLTKAIFEQISLTTITVESVDMAFTFFDTQNNRGVPLECTDLLKAYHLRAIDGEARERLQKLCASRWEEIQKSREVISNDKDFTPSLFAKFLWRARTWRGQQVFFDDDDKIIHEFQDRATPNQSATDKLPLYRSRRNRLASSLTLHEQGHTELATFPISLGNDSADLPFALRQPVHEGIGFFLYADKYTRLLQRLINEPATNLDVLAFREVYDKLVRNHSIFLKQSFLLCILAYYDQFGEERLFEYSLWLDRAMGSLRMHKSSVYAPTAKNFFNYTDERTYNLLDVISQAYLPDEIINSLRDDSLCQRMYEERDSTDIAPNSVRGRYRRDVLNYFGKSEQNLSERADWITESFVNSKKQEVAQ